MRVFSVRVDVPLPADSVGGGASMRALLWCFFFDDADLVCSFVRRRVLLGSRGCCLALLVWLCSAAGSWHVGPACWMLASMWSRVVRSSARSLVDEIVLVLCASCYCVA